MDKYIYDEKNGLWYELQGDYYLPCLKLPGEVEEKDYLQVFTLTKTPAGQHIVHEQEQPPYRYELDVPCDDAVNAKVFVIDDLTHSTMLLAEEY